MQIVESTDHSRICHSHIHQCPISVRRRMDHIIPQHAFDRLPYQQVPHTSSDEWLRYLRSHDHYERSSSKLGATWRMDQARLLHAHVLLLSLLHDCRTHSWIGRWITFVVVDEEKWTFMCVLCFRVSFVVLLSFLHRCSQKIRNISELGYFPCIYASFSWLN